MATDKSGKDGKLLEKGNQEKNVLNGKRVVEEEEEKDEFKKPLLPRKGGLSKKSGKKHQKVQWNDKNGNKLTEVLVYQPSEDSDSEDEDSDSCMCTIM